LQAASVNIETSFYDLLYKYQSSLTYSGKRIQYKTLIHSKTYIDG